MTNGKLSEVIGAIKAALIGAYMQGVIDCPDDKYCGRVPTESDAQDCAGDLLSDLILQKVIKEFESPTPKERT